MARVQYGPENNPVELRLVRIVDLDMKPAKDPSGTDRVLTQVDLTMAFQWSPFATSSNLLNKPAPPYDFPGLSVQQLHQVLSFPHQTFRFMIGADVVWEVPDTVGGQRLGCDAGYGPEILGLSLRELEGEKLAVGTWKIRFYVTDCSNILLSNRWTVTATTNANAMTQRTVEGWAQMRADAISAVAGPRGIDNFRRWFIVPCPAGFRRGPVRVQVNESNTKARYVCLDVQDPNPLGILGQNTGIAKFTGEATAGITEGATTHKEQIGFGLGALANLFSLNLPGYIALGVSRLPREVAMGWVKVEGGKDVSKVNLLRVGVCILQDRFPNCTVVSCIATQGLGSSEQEGRWVKVVMMFLPKTTTYVGNALHPWAVDKMMSFANDIRPLQPNGMPLLTPAGAPAVFPGDTPTSDGVGLNYFNANLPNGKRPGDANSQTGSRGSWLGELLCQSLQSQCEPPDVPPANLYPALASDLV